MSFQPHPTIAAPAEQGGQLEPLPCVASSTALKWGQDGELSELDRERILRRLAAVDPVAEALGSGRFNPGQPQSA
ncbi:hypothetical protein [Synechococcus sp. GFB01]|uniref:hypothetical protein n=1 Tax=Synechococcus sp. GFB01 TaxID=1662190 RepID=UPI00064EA084|nr:hypothetical protein [Synechococcus sp. GFB01]KMM16983.1 hypothetical protein SYNGFB01_07210 [Synechococcus sp. GFB01]